MIGFAAKGAHILACVYIIRPGGRDGLPQSALSVIISTFSIHLPASFALVSLIAVWRCTACLAAFTCLDQALRASSRPCPGAGFRITCVWDGGRATCHPVPWVRGVSGLGRVSASARIAQGYDQNHGSNIIQGWACGTWGRVSSVGNQTCYNVTIERDDSVLHHRRCWTLF
ncbi:hypothetical protein BU23DRAFT_188296 [Bimuria novae-zelandiae CBS 107.79]|uniref:Uncharacterized protein n=1 Tax=Bimuria novae-zelandiae CBS 107.79 TaxID=1447943 RepID=A0A6A5VQB3_9PLEO|nr:hypothetical protein BU23DRAFT_188296 [Bimuria novae-zelandiae CBS 107.79]